MNEGKAKVIGEVIKQQGMFKAARIVEATGLSQQLVYHHLKSLVADGYLEKDGTKYGVVARQDLVDSLVSIGENNVTGLFPNSTEFSAKFLNARIEMVVLMRGARMKDNDKARMIVAGGLDELIAQCKAARRYLNSKSISEKKAISRLEKEWETWWPHLQKFVEADKDKVYNALAKRQLELDKEC